MFERHWKHKWLFSDIRMNSVIGWLPGQSSKPSNYLTKLCLHKYDRIGLSITKLMKCFDWKIILRCFIQHLCPINLYWKQFLNETCILFTSNYLGTFKLQWLFNFHIEVIDIQEALLRRRWGLFAKNSSRSFNPSWALLCLYPRFWFIKIGICSHWNWVFQCDRLIMWIFYPFLYFVWKYGFTVIEIRLEDFKAWTYLSRDKGE